MRRFSRFLFRHWRLSLCMVGLLGGTIAILCLRNALRGLPAPLEVSIKSDNTIDLTPAQITRIRSIGKWEFLSVRMEEIVDTTHHRMLLSDEQLIRIYQGTVRLGIDMNQLADNWFSARGDTAFLHLPPIRALDERFIDEANVQTFYEAGSWDNQARERLYQKARRQMKARLHRTSAYRQAEANGREQMTSLMRSFGFRTVVVKFWK